MAPLAEEEDLKAAGQHALNDRQAAGLKGASLEQAAQQMQALRESEDKQGLQVSPYGERGVPRQERRRVFEMLVRVASQSKISDHALLLAFLLFDQVMQETYLFLRRGGAFNPEALARPFVGFACLYTAAKFEDLRFPFFSAFKRICLTELTRNAPELAAAF